MSASKKKQQRREAVDVEKVNQAQAEQAAYKKKARLYTIIGVVIVVLVAALLIWNSGIFQKNATAATIGDTKLSAAELGYYYYDARYIYAMYGLLDNSLSDADQSFSEDQTYQDFFLETALSNAQKSLAMYNAAREAGYTDADVKENVESQVNSMKLSAASNGYDYAPFLKAVYGPYMTPSVFEKMITREFVASLYANDTYNEAYDSYTSADLEAYYAEHADDVDIITYSYLYFKADTVDTKDADGNALSDDEIAALKEAAMATAKNKADAVLANFDNGLSIADLIETSKPTSSGDHTTAAGVSGISSIYREDLMKLDADKATVVENKDTGYYVIVYHGRERSETLSANVRHILFQAAATTDAEGKLVAPTESVWAEAKAKAEAALAEYENGEHTAEAFGALAEKYSVDTGSNTNGGLYEGVCEGDFVTEFNDWMFGDKQPAVGETALIRHEGDTANSNSYWGYHVTRFEGWGEAEWQLTVRKALSTNAMEELQNGLIEKCPAELASGAYNLGK